MEHLLRLPVLICLLTLLFVSCKQDEQELSVYPIVPSITTTNDSLFVSFSQAEEIASLTDASGSLGVYDVETARKDQKEKKKKVKSSKTFKDKNDRNAFYVFNYDENQGFSIVSADMRLEPILAYSDSSYFAFDTTENPGLSEWLESLQEYITLLRDGSISDTASSQNDGARIAYGWKSKKTSIKNAKIDPGDNPNPPPPFYPIQTYGPLVKSEWGQGCGFNDFTPSKSKGSCGHSPAGCGPVAVAQVMWYYRSRFRSMTYNGVPINFNNMPLSLTFYRTGESPDIARLMRFIGDWVIIDYATDYAMALPEKIPTFLNNMGFSSDLKDLDHATVMNEIKSGRPVILKAKTPAFLISLNHHIWVCDGYQYNPNTGAKYYRMNWGWYGGQNGWFGIDNWTPSGNDYTKGRKMIVVR